MPIRSDAVVLDIGQGVGALVVYVRAQLPGRLIEVSPKDLDSPRWHTEIRERLVRGRTVFAGVFPQLPAGGYRIWADNREMPTVAKIVSGQVVEIDLR